MSLNQKGFSLVEGLLVIIAITLIAGVGYYVYDANKNVDELQTQSEVQTGAKPTKKYLEVKELGLKFNKSDIPGVYYKMGLAYPDHPEVKALSIYDTAYDNTTNSKGNKCESDTPIANVEIITVSDRDSKYAQFKDAEMYPSQPTPVVLSDKYNKKVGKYLYLAYKAQGVQAGLNCISDVYGSSIDEATLQKVQDDNAHVKNKFNESFKAIEQMLTTIQPN